MKNYLSTRHFVGSGLTILILFIIALLYSAEWMFSDRKNVTEEVIKDTELVSTEISGVEMDKIDIPTFLRRSFPNTDFSKADISLESALSGGPSKDGIPSIDNPKFIPISDFSNDDSIQAIVLDEGEYKKVYPYNILNWHEIVNDEANEKPVSITFCPLCGSAIVYDRTLPNGDVTTFGVSGGLLESNMIMYDRMTESLWQQSVGEALAGENLGAKLEHVEFQLLTIREIKEKYPNARVMSDDTGYRRDYSRNPYSGYAEDNNQFVFGTSKFSGEFEAKEIMVVFKVGETFVTTPWLSFKDGVTKKTTIDGAEITLNKTDGELIIINSENQQIPFYFEMWFSFAVQHGEEGIVME